MAYDSSQKYSKRPMSPPPLCIRANKYQLIYPHDESSARLLDLVFVLLISLSAQELFP